jgi:hypothetical protein
LPLAQYLPFSRKGSIVFTTWTREAAVKIGREYITVGAMDINDATKLLQTSLAYKLTKSDEKITTRLLDLLANLPLAMRQASAYMNQQQMSTLNISKYMGRVIRL